MTRGFEDTQRFRSTFAVEWDADAAETYRRNFGDHVFEGPIEDVESFPAADVVIGGPPCQGFSPLNMGGVGLDRRSLWRQYLRALKQSNPVAFVMENVPELLPGLAGRDPFERLTHSGPIERRSASSRMAAS